MSGLACWGHQGVAQVELCAPKTGNPLVWTYQLCKMCLMLAPSCHPWQMPFLGGNLLRPKLQQRVFRKSAGNIASDSGSLRRPLLVGFWPCGEAHKSREVQPGPDRPPQCLLFVLADT
eukprot:1157521-Pelagomonas_calceolata.AAC.9